LNLKYLFKWKTKGNNGNWFYKRKRINAEDEVTAWIRFFLWAGGMDAEDFILMKYRQKTIAESFRYIQEFVSVEEMKNIFTNFMKLGMISKMEKLNMERIK